MSEKLLHSLEDRLPWGTIGAALSVLSLLVGLYLSLFYNRSPQLRVEAFANAPVYAIHENVPSLEIKFEGDDIRARGLTLSVLTAKVSNPSRVDILKSFFDDQAPIRFNVSGSRIIEFSVPFASSGYLSEKVRLSRENPETLRLDPIILEQGMSFTMRLLVLHPKATEPHLHVEGKVAGVPKLEVVEQPRVTQTGSLWRLAFQGDFLIQVLRLIGYTIGALLLLITAGFGIDSASTWIVEGARRRRISTFRRTLDERPTAAQESVIEGYVSTGEDFLVRLDAVLSDPNKLREIFRAKHSEKRRRRPTPAEQVSHIHVAAILYESAWMDPMPEAMRANKWVTISQDGTVTADEEVTAFVRRLLLFVQAHVPEKVKRAKRMLRSNAAHLRALPKSEQTNVDEPN